MSLNCHVSKYTLKLNARVVHANNFSKNQEQLRRGKTGVQPNLKTNWRQTMVQLEAKHRYNRGQLLLIA